MTKLQLTSSYDRGELIFRFKIEKSAISTSSEVVNICWTGRDWLSSLSDQLSLCMLISRISKRWRRNDNDEREEEEEEEEDGEDGEGHDYDDDDDDGLGQLANLQRGLVGGIGGGAAEWYKNNSL